MSNPLMEHLAHVNREAEIHAGIEHAATKLRDFVLTLTSEPRDEWMQSLVHRINRLNAAIGDPARYRFGLRPGIAGGGSIELVLGDEPVYVEAH